MKIDTHTHSLSRFTSIHMLMDPSNTSTVPLPNASTWILSPLTHFTGVKLLAGPVWHSLANTHSFQRHPTLVHPSRYHHKLSPCLIPLSGPGSSYTTWSSSKFASKLDTPPPPTPTCTRFGKNARSSPPTCWHPGPVTYCPTPAAGTMDAQTVTPGVTAVASSEFTNSLSNCYLSTHTWGRVRLHR